jgi:23S rRNA pseudouridine2605 synthase
VKVLGRRGDHVRLEIRIHEGRNRQVRRMLDAVDIQVIDLTRTALGPLTLQGLPEGEYRTLTESEIQALMRQLGL